VGLSHPLKVGLSHPLKVGLSHPLKVGHTTPCHHNYGRIMPTRNQGMAFLKRVI
jgi:hypothetical protein